MSEAELIRREAADGAELGDPNAGRTSHSEYATGFWAKIGTSADVDSKNRYKYAWEEVHKKAVGYDGWSVVTNGRSGTTATDPAYNFVEDMNEASGQLGAGPTVANLDTADYTFALEACPSGVLVWMHEVFFVDGSHVGQVEYWFSYENGVDGTCD